METSVKSILEKTDWLRTLQCRKQECEDELNSIVATLSKVIAQETQPESPCYQQSCEGVEANRLEDPLSAKTLSVEMERCMEALTQPNLESDEEEVGREDHHPSTIVNFCRKAMGIYDYELTVDPLEELGCTPKDVMLVLRYLRTKHKSDTMVTQSLGGSYWVHSIY